MISSERIPHNGLLVLRALVTDGQDEFYQRFHFCGYSESEARKMFLERLNREGLQFVK